jgi:hypothetical protein
VPLVAGGVGVGDEVVGGAGEVVGGPDEVVGGDGDCTEVMVAVKRSVVVVGSKVVPLSPPGMLMGAGMGAGPAESSKLKTRIGGQIEVSQRRLMRTRIR